MSDKFYCGIPEPSPSVVIIENGKVRSLGEFTWTGKTDPNCHRLAKALLADAMGYDGARYVTRFRWRMAPEWQANKYWRLSIEDVLKVVDDIKRTWEDAQPMVRRAALEPAPPVIPETGIGVGGRKIGISDKDQSAHFRRNPDITRDSK